jgi:exopolyphosphatase/guanosine-5'-triphosphate,3'-diphosphate pyrophosphatase
MLVARPAVRGFQVIDAFSRATRLGEGLAKSGTLSEAAMDRTILALKTCVEKIGRRGVTRARYVATQACRQASNCSDFIDRVTDQTGLEIEIISAQEEAGLALAGCSGLLDRRLTHALVFDIGGGSTELIWVRLDRGTPEHIEAIASLPFGVVTLTETQGEALSSLDGYDRLVSALSEEFRAFENRCCLAGRIRARKMQMLGTSGTVTTLGGVYLDLPRYDRLAIDGLVMPFSAITEVSRRLAAMTPEERCQHPCIGQERSELVVAGCAILEAVCRIWPLGRLRVADRGVREGLLLNMMRADVAAAAE